MLKYARSWASGAARTQAVCRAGSGRAIPTAAAAARSTQPCRFHRTNEATIQAQEAPFRTHMCSVLPSLVPCVSSSAPSPVLSSPLVLSGWLQSSRDLGGEWFGRLRDSSGAVQITWTRRQAEEEGQADVYDQIIHTPLESVMTVTGQVEPRPEKMINPAQATGNIEVRIKTATILNRCTATLPFSLESGDAPPDDHRLKYRFLDLRRPWMQYILQLRSSVLRSVRDVLHAADFTEIETPLLFKSTPEGADEFLVPSRHKDKFYALPQSPQQHKQLLMVSGVNRYFQIARCFRDEGSRADRQPEFTQIDLEMAFVKRGDVMEVIERLLNKVLRDNLPEEDRQQIKDIMPMKKMTYAEAMREYGSDKPDTRYELRLQDLTSLVRSTLASSSSTSPPVSCPVFSSVLSHPDGSIRALRVPGFLSFASRKDLDSLQSSIGKNVLMVRVKEDGLKTPAIFQGLFSDAEFSRRVRAELALETDDLLLVAASHSSDVSADILGKARVQVAHKLVEKNKLTIPATQMNMFWVTDFPLFDLTLPSEVGAPVTLASLALSAKHHPFTAAHVADVDQLDRLMTELEAARAAGGFDTIRDVTLTSEQIVTLRSIRSETYDVVCNGIELGGGSIRLHRPDDQRRILTMFGANMDVFQHLLHALTFGAPPHGGIALGLDRLLAIIGAAKQERNIKQQQQQQQQHSSKSPQSPSSSSYSYGLPLPIRDVIAFPKSTSGQDLMVDAPSTVPKETLKQYHIQTTTEDEK